MITPIKKSLWKEWQIEYQRKRKEKKVLRDKEYKVWKKEREVKQKLKRENKTSRVTCDVCAVILSFQKKDIKSKDDGWGGNKYDYIDCPNCKYRIKLHIYNEE